MPCLQLQDCLEILSLTLLLTGNEQRSPSPLLHGPSITMGESHC